LTNLHFAQYRFFFDFFIFLLFIHVFFIGTVFPPSETSKLYPTRLPFEESSVFSQVDTFSPNLDIHPLFATANSIQITLYPGQMLFVPHHFWHFVECIDDSISVNLWLDHPRDDQERLKESLARFVVSGLKEADVSEEPKNWLNRGEELWDMETNAAVVRHCLKPCIDGASETTATFECDTAMSKAENECENETKSELDDVSIDDIVNAFAHPQTLDLVAQLIIQSKNRIQTHHNEQLHELQERGRGIKRQKPEF
jgi:hypothetical protein